MGTRNLSVNALHQSSISLVVHNCLLWASSVSVSYHDDAVPNRNRWNALTIWCLHPPPSEHRLSDALVFLIIGHNAVAKRNHHGKWPADFNSDGDVYPDRWPMGEPVFLWAFVWSALYCSVQRLLHPRGLTSTEIHLAGDQKTKPRQPNPRRVPFRRDHSEPGKSEYARRQTRIANRLRHVRLVKFCEEAQPSRGNK